MGWFGVFKFTVNQVIAWVDQVWRSNGITKVVLKRKLDSKRPLGRLKQRWIDNFKEKLVDIWIYGSEK